MTLLMTPAEAARQLAISEKQLRELASLGKIRYVNVGNGEKRETRRYAEQDLARFIEARSKQECRSTDAPAKRSTRSTSGVVVHDFQALRAARAAERRKSSRKASATEPGHP
jgi:excisionase family DNA binding protein